MYHSLGISPWTFYGVFPSMSLKAFLKSALSFPLIVTIFRLFSSFWFLKPAIKFLVLCKTYQGSHIFLLPETGQHSIGEFQTHPRYSWSASWLSTSPRFHLPRASVYVKLQQNTADFCTTAEPLWSSELSSRLFLEGPSYLDFLTELFESFYW